MRLFNSNIKANNGEGLSNFLHALAALPFGLMALDVVSHIITKLI